MQASDPGGPASPLSPEPPSFAAIAAQASPDGMLLTDGLGNVTWGNDAVLEKLGYGSDELVGTNVFDLLDEDEQHLALQAVTLIGAAPDKVQPAIYHPIRRDGRRIPVEINGTAVTDNQGNPGLVLITRDADHQAVLTEGVSRLSEGDDLDAVVLDVLRELTERWGGYHAALVIFDGDERRFIGSLPEPFVDLIVTPSPNDDLPWEAAFTKDEIVPCLTDDLPTAAAAALRDLHLAGVLAVPVPDPDGPRGVLVLAADVDAPFLLRTFWKQSPTFLLLRFALARRYWVSKLQTAASTDPLTGLANRATFFTALESRSDAAQDQMAVLYIDLDDFKPVNDRLGHAVGDVVLTTVAERLEATVRPGDVVSRIGGDELAVLCPVDDDHAATLIADRLLAAVAEEMTVAGHRIQISTSIGIALGDPAIESVDELIERADRALYDAKRAGKGRWVVAEPP